MGIKYGWEKKPLIMPDVVHELYINPLKEGRLTDFGYNVSICLVDNFRRMFFRTSQPDDNLERNLSSLDSGNDGISSKL